MTLLICPVRPGEANDELRFAIRSWETHLHLGSELQLWTVGYKPTWLQPDRHIDGNRYKSVGLVVFDNVLLASHAAVEAGLGDDDALYMNDDFFCLDPIGAVLPVRRDISLRQHLESFPSNGPTWWPQSLQQTLRWLEEKGYEDPHSFEVHRPLVAKPADMVAALEQWEGGMEPPIPQWRTVYGVLNEVEAYPVKDGKLGLKTPGIGTPWLSTSDHSWRRYSRSFIKRFQKPARWELQS